MNNQLKEILIASIDMTENEIYSLPEREIDTILDKDNLPSDNYSLFLDHAYEQFNKLLQEYNSLL